MNKIIAFLVFVFLSVSAAQAATYYESEAACKAAATLGEAVGYQPTARHKKFGESRVAGLDKRPLEGDACAFIGAAPGKRWVFLKKGTLVYTSGPEVKYLGECQNDIYHINFIKDEVPPVAVASAGCATDGCGNVTRTVVENIVVDQRVTCRSPDGTTVPGEIRSKKAVCPDIQIETPVRVTAPVSCATCGQSPSVPPAKPATGQSSSCDADCLARLANIRKLQDRTDGRCVLELRNDAGESRFVRFDTATKNGEMLLVVAKVNDFQGEWNRSNTPTYVGKDVGGVAQTVKITGKPDCAKTIKTFALPEVLKWTGPRLGLTPTCRPVTSLSQSRPNT